VFLRFIPLFDIIKAMDYNIIKQNLLANDFEQLNKNISNQFLLEFLLLSPIYASFFKASRNLESLSPFNLIFSDYAKTRGYAIYLTSD
jgi:hypothetical protein